MLYVTCDMLHVACDMWHVKCCGGWTISQNVSSLAHSVCDLWYFEDLEEKDESLSQWISDKGICRTASATPGLLINNRKVKK